MATPTKFRLTLTVLADDEVAVSSHSQWFAAFHSGSCTLAQHYSAKLWYEMQMEIESRLNAKNIAAAKEAALSETR